MLRFLYISTAQQITTRGQPGRVLRVSRERNTQVGVTGLQIAGGKHFLQGLEGSTEVVETTFERIRRDERHLGVVVARRFAQQQAA